MATSTLSTSTSLADNSRLKADHVDLDLVVDFDGSPSICSDDSVVLDVSVLDQVDAVELDVELREGGAPGFAISPDGSRAFALTPNGSPGFRVQEEKVFSIWQRCSNGLERGIEVNETSHAKVETFYKRILELYGLSEGVVDLTDCKLFYTDEAGHRHEIDLVDNKHYCTDEKGNRVEIDTPDNIQKELKECLRELKKILRPYNPNGPFNRFIYHEGHKGNFNGPSPFRAVGRAAQLAKREFGFFNKMWRGMRGKSINPESRDAVNFAKTHLAILLKRHPNVDHQKIIMKRLALANLYYETFKDKIDNLYEELKFEYRRIEGDVDRESAPQIIQDYERIKRLKDRFETMDRFAIHWALAFAPFENADQASVWQKQVAALEEDLKALMQSNKSSLQKLLRRDPSDLHKSEEDYVHDVAGLLVPDRLSYVRHCRINQMKVKKTREEDELFMQNIVDAVNGKEYDNRFFDKLARSRQKSLNNWGKNIVNGKARSIMAQIDGLDLTEDTEENVNKFISTVLAPNG